MGDNADFFCDCYLIPCCPSPTLETMLCECTYFIAIDVMCVFVSAAEAHPVPGGVFPVPPAGALLMELLPPPDCFHVSTHYIIHTIYC